MGLKVNSGYRRTPEGTYDWCIVDVEYKKAFGKVKLKFKAEPEGYTMTRSLPVEKSPGEPDWGMDVLSTIAMAALGVKEGDDLEPEDLKGAWVRASVTHQEKEGKTFANIGYFEPSERGEAGADEGDGDLDDLLGAL